ncbi:hypothetical protein HJG54_26915 [Leptolyngbya sp. NK1-12]|uniref:4Fe-4S binding protein n=1 Tax=Leptolyngbya sp. NK1-12 TaxID=2547451 RepID=A0AA97AI10_9CYAN|nr:hypothetical protein [Leptolyngbya sp. NK1-12]WNZ26100.1 hypothetical protein HJG54_26915 [Leptolyngbya sp. NK1-12]
MFARIPEKFIHLTRWSLTLGWLLLIASLFVDPFSAQLTAPGQVFAASQDCFQFQGECRPLDPYPMGARIFWGMVLPLAVLMLLIFGHEAWRRICPLSFMAQLARGLGWQRKRTISETSWLGRNALYLQMGLLFIGLNLRLLLVNSDRWLLGIFLIFTIVSAITIGFLYDGKTWCNYFCPMAPVQMIYSEPSGLLGSAAHTAPPKTITQSMCRTVDQNGQEKSACVACKTGCIDIDAEAAYWDTIRQADRKLLYYGYVGLVIGFYLYFGLYSGNWRLLSAGVWNETDQLATLMQPGFFIAGRAIPIPKLLAVPLTLTLSTGMTYMIGLWVELKARRTNKRLGYPLSLDQVQSRLFAISTFMAFNLLFFLGVRPTLGYLPLFCQQLLSWIAIVVSSLWLAKTWYRSAQKYNRERDANLLKRQLHKLNIDLYQALEGRSLDDLNPDELYALAKVLPGFTQANRLQVYRGILREAFEQKSVIPAKSLKAFQPMRQNLGIDEESHWAVLQTLQLEEPHLFTQQRWQTQAMEATLYRSADAQNLSNYSPTDANRTEIGTKAKTAEAQNLEATVYRSADVKISRQPAAEPKNPANRQPNPNSENTTVVKPFEDSSNEATTGEEQ